MESNAQYVTKEKLHSVVPNTHISL